MKYDEVTENKNRKCGADLFYPTLSSPTVRDGDVGRFSGLSVTIALSVDVFIFCRDSFSSGIEEVFPQKKQRKFQETRENRSCSTVT